MVTLYDNFDKGLIETYLAAEVERCAKVPIITNPGLEALRP